MSKLFRLVLVMFVGLGLSLTASAKEGRGQKAVKKVPPQTSMASQSTVKGRSHRNSGGSHGGGTIQRPPRQGGNTGHIGRDRRPVRPIRTIGRDNRYNNGSRQTRLHDRYQHRPAWNRSSTTYYRHTHVPYRYNTDQRNGRHYSSARFYHYTIPYRFIYWNRWIRFRVTFDDGYRYYNDYPYFVYNGYLHRYSSYDNCNYDLVDGYTNEVVREYHSYTCQRAYDYCAELRDDLNWDENGYRYFCSEEFDYDSSYDYHWNERDDYYSDLDRTYFQY